VTKRPILKESVGNKIETKRPHNEYESQL